MMSTGGSKTYWVLSYPLEMRNSSKHWVHTNGLPPPRWGLPKKYFSGAQVPETFPIYLVTCLLKALKLEGKLKTSWRPKPLLPHHRPQNIQTYTVKSMTSERRFQGFHGSAPTVEMSLLGPEVIFGYLRYLLHIASFARLEMASPKQPAVLTFFRCSSCQSLMTSVAKHHTENAAEAKPQAKLLMGVSRNKETS